MRLELEVGKTAEIVMRWVVYFWEIDDLAPQGYIGQGDNQPAQTVTMVKHYGFLTESGEFYPVRKSQHNGRYEEHSNAAYNARGPLEHMQA